nr:hypothetical protein [Saprospiraceae bacterium]
YDGIIGGPVSFQIIDKAIDVPTGTYSLTAVFRTKDVIFDSLKLELLVYNSYLQTCVQHDLKTYRIESNSCSEVDTFLTEAITLTYRDEESRYVTNILDASKLDYFKVLDPSCNINFYHSSIIPGFNTGQFYIGFEDKLCKISFNLKPNNTSTQKTCNLVYKTE